MSFSLDPKQTTEDNIRRIASEEVDAARGFLLQPPAGDKHEGVHEARKCFKRLRGLLRMARPALGNTLYRQENARFRDAAATLSEARDAQALIESFDRLEKVYGRRVNWARLQPLRLELIARRARLEHEASDLEGRIQEAVQALDEAQHAIVDWPLAEADCTDLADGLQQVYARARKEWKAARDEHDPVVLHEWRKPAKYMRYQFELLRGVDSDWAIPAWQGFKRLGDLLGDHHDLDVLRVTLDTLQTTGLDPVAECEFRTLLRENQDTIYREALQLGERLLQRKPGAMRERVLKRLKGRLAGC